MNQAGRLAALAYAAGLVVTAAVVWRGPQGSAAMTSTDEVSVAAVPMESPLSAPGQDPKNAKVTERGFTPTSLVLPHGGQAEVVNVAVSPDGSLAVPDNPAVVGHWNAGAAPGSDAGAVIMAGHVDSRRYGLGFLAELADVRVGQSITVAGKGRQQRYQVITRQQVPQQSLATNADLFATTGPPRLVLITCGGTFDPVRRRYSDNLIVTAVPVTTGTSGGLF